MVCERCSTILYLAFFIQSLRDFSFFLSFFFLEIFQYVKLPHLLSGCTVFLWISDLEHPSVNGHLGCIQLFTATNRAVGIILSHALDIGNSVPK